MTLRKQAEDDKYSHFNAVVPEALKHKLLELAEAAKDGFVADLGGWPEAYGTERIISAIYGYDPGGFIPFQLGGYEVSELYRSDIDSTYHISAAQTEAMNKAQEDCYKSFAWDYSEELAKHYASLAQPIPDAKEISYSDIEAAGLENAFSDYENEWFEPALLRLEIWIDDPKDKGGMFQPGKTPASVYVRLGLNYLDQPYYRSKSDETLFEFNMTAKQAARMTGENFVRLLKAKYEKGDF